MVRNAKERSIPQDDIIKVFELDGEGYGRNTISIMTGIPSSTVRNVLEGKDVTINTRLSVRERQTYLSRWQT